MQRSTPAFGDLSIEPDDPPTSPVRPGRPFAILPRSPSELLEPARAPEPPRRLQRREWPKVSNLIRRLNSALTFALMLLLIGAAVLTLVHRQFDQPGPLQYSTVVTIPRGEGVQAISERLERDGIVSDRRLFTLSYLWVTATSPDRRKPQLKAGEYEIRRGASIRQVLDTLVEGKSILYKVSVPEGRTSSEIVDILRQEVALTGDIVEVPAEGSLLPDTYKFSRGMDRRELIERMRDEQRKFVEKLWQTRAPDLPYKSIEEALILASIVEKETGRADERDRIAGVFINRLRRGMRLQSDPTIIYGITLGKQPLGRPIYEKDIREKTQYNTYQIDGLPPTPICNPGRAAIEAVLNPAETTDIFFVADGTGGHAFAATLKEHQQNVRNWREIERKIRAEQKIAATEAAITPSTGDDVALPERHPKR